MIRAQIRHTIFTHNPQLFFEGGEPEDLVIRQTLTFPDDLPLLTSLTSSGFYAIIPPHDGEAH